jgi:8-oxo-dGTP pyrophosphatase MutT (NUDIX family)
MSSTQPSIRVLALGLIQTGGNADSFGGDRLFVSHGYDPVKQQSFYRALGGKVEFGETSLAALQREFQEEIQAELTNIHYLGCLENFFTFNGTPGHEIVQLYRCDFADPRFYQLQQLTFTELEDRAQQPHTASWIELERFRSGELRLVPEACLQYL